LSKGRQLATGVDPKASDTLKQAKKAETELYFQNVDGSDQQQRRPPVTVAEPRDRRFHADSVISAPSSTVSPLPKLRAA
jgi:hypothetical protein